MLSVLLMPTQSIHARGYYESPIGTLEVRSSDRGIFSLTFVQEEQDDAGIHDILQPCMDQLHSYFSTEKHSFHSLQLAIHSTDFQLKVWESVSEIPYGTTVTYGEIAKVIGHPNAVRAVGTAVGRNPLPVIIPCHRVLPASGNVGEYSCGVWRKEWLLEHEQKSRKQ